MSALGRGQGKFIRDPRKKHDDKGHFPYRTEGADGLGPREILGARPVTGVGPASLPVAGMRPDSRDERFRDISRLASADLIGPRTALGQRYFDERDLDYLQSKRDKAKDIAFVNLVEDTYDVQDPYQAEQVKRMFPQYESTRRAVLDACFDQMRFIGRMSTTVGGLSNGDDLKRLVAILGTAEPLALHPSLRYLNAGGQQGKTIAGYGDNLGLWSFGSHQGRTGAAGRAKDSTEWRAVNKAERVSIAREVLHLFPRMLTGRYEEMAGIEGAVRGRRDAKSAAELVKLCEDACIPYDDLATFIMEDPIGQRSELRRLASP